MNTDEQREEFGKLCARAKRAGLLRAAYPEHGIAVLAAPPLPPAPVGPPEAAVPVAPGAPAGSPPVTGG